MKLRRGNNMSCGLTVPQVENRTKTVSRRLGFDWVEVGDILCLCGQMMGLKKGDTVRRLALVKVVSVRLEKLSAITREDVAREGFPGWGPNRFIDFYCQSQGGGGDQYVRRIEWRYIVGGRLS